MRTLPALLPLLKPTHIFAPLGPNGYPSVPLRAVRGRHARLGTRPPGGGERVVRDARGEAGAAGYQVPAARRLGAPRPPAPCTPQAPYPSARDPLQLDGQG